jgi:hypothetical protein
MGKLSRLMNNRSSLFGVGLAASIVLVAASAGAAPPPATPEPAAPSAAAGAPAAAPAAAPPAAAPAPAPAASAAAQATPPASAAEASAGAAAASAASSPSPELPSSATTPPKSAPGALATPRVVVVEGAGSAGTTSDSAVPTAKDGDNDSPRTEYTHRFSIYLEDRIVWLTNPGYDLFSENDEAAAGGLTAEVDLMRLSAPLVLSVEAGFLVESAHDNVLGGELAADLSSNTYQIGARVRDELLSWVTVHARATMGLSDADIELSSGDYQSANATGKYHTSPLLYQGSLGVGGTVQVPPYYRLGGGIIVEGGYLVSSSAPLSLKQDRADNAVSVEEASLGTLGRSGPYLRLGLFVRF